MLENLEKGKSPENLKKPISEISTTTGSFDSKKGSSVEENKVLISRLVAARNDHDLEAFVAFFVKDGKEQVRKAFNQVTEAFPDVQITVKELIGEGEKIVSYWLFQGTHLGLYQDIPATGRRVKYNGVDIYTIVDGQILSLVRVVDNLVVLRQLGITGSDQQQTD